MTRHTRHTRHTTAKGQRPRWRSMTPNPIATGSQRWWPPFEDVVLHPRPFVFALEPRDLGRLVGMRHGPGFESGAAGAGGTACATVPPACPERPTQREIRVCRMPNSAANDIAVRPVPTTTSTAWHLAPILARIGARLGRL